MILAAALLVLVGLALFVAGIFTGTTALYWACVAACVVAAVLLIAVRRRLPASEKAGDQRAADDRAADGKAADRKAGDETGRADVTVAATRRSDQADRPVERSVVEQAPPPEPRQPEVAPAVSTGSTAIPPAEIPPVRSARDEPTGAHAADLEPGAAASAPPAAPPEQGEPPLEEVEVTDLLLVMDLRDEVLVVDEHPRYHLSGCRYLRGRTTIPLPIDEARTDGFTPCGICTPDRRLADRVRASRRVQGN